MKSKESSAGKQDLVKQNHRRQQVKIWIGDPSGKAEDEIIGKNLEIPQKDPKKKIKLRRLSKMEALHLRDAQRASCLTFCRDTITRLADRSSLQKAQIETLLADRVGINTLIN